MYSPFDKNITHLQHSDLAILKTVSEGWYVEYKSESISASALAKAISAFANTYGGWLFLGIQELGKDDPVAGSFPGIPEKDVDAILQRLRQSAAEYLNPVPHFETKVLRGPCSQIELAAGAAIVAIEIPQSHTAPHIHKDGRIYRRVADASEPKPETDRFILDQLWNRGEPIRKMTRKWIERDPEFSEAEEEVPYVRLLLCVDPWGQRNPMLTAHLPQVRSILISGKIGIQNVPFDTFYTTSYGFIARQVKGNDPHNYGLTWKISRDLSCEIIIPLPKFVPNDTDGLLLDLDGYNQAKHFVEILKNQGYLQPRIADLNFLMSLLVGVISKYRRLLKLFDMEMKFYFKSRILNVWRLLPFIDIGSVLEEYVEHGLPVIFDSNVTFPAGDEPESFMFIDEIEKETDEIGGDLAGQIQANLVFTWIAIALGVPILVEGESVTDTTIVPTADLVDAGERAMTVQRNRNMRRSVC